MFGFKKESWFTGLLPHLPRIALIIGGLIFVLMMVSFLATNTGGSPLDSVVLIKDTYPALHPVKLERENFYLTPGMIGNVLAANNRIRWDPDDRSGTITEEWPYEYYISHFGVPFEFSGDYFDAVAENTGVYEYTVPVPVDGITTAYAVVTCTQCGSFTAQSSAMSPSVVVLDSFVLPGTETFLMVYSVEVPSPNLMYDLKLSLAEQGTLWALTLGEDNGVHHEDGFRLQNLRPNVFDQDVFENLPCDFPRYGSICRVGDIPFLMTNYPVSLYFPVMVSEEVWLLLLVNDVPPVFVDTSGNVLDQQIISDDTLASGLHRVVIYLRWDSSESLFISQTPYSVLGITVK